MKDRRLKDEVRRYTEQNLEALAVAIDALHTAIRANYVNILTVDEDGRSKWHLPKKGVVGLADIRNALVKEVAHIKAVRRAVVAESGCAHLKVRWICNRIGDREHVECHECGAQFDRPKEDES